ncbi:MAG: OadG family protein [Sedimenticola sp.]|nr:OadG family protein [Sedimenticola sp.]
MQVSNLLTEGVNLMFLGMGSVFVFLTVLVLAMSAVAYLVRTLFKDDSREIVSPQLVIPQTETEGGELIAVIAAAINRYRAK